MAWYERDKEYENRVWRMLGIQVDEEQWQDAMRFNDELVETLLESERNCDEMADQTFRARLSVDDLLLLKQMHIKVGA